MVTKGIVEEIINIYQAKVRLPVYDGFADTKNATPSNELTIASICNIPNIYNTIAVGDIVYVAFEDNDLGNPVILGQLYKEEMNTLTDIKLNSANINQLTVNKNASLPQNTSIGSISSKEIAALSGIKDNIQNQIDMNLPAINFAESERQKSETDGAITHNLDASVVFAENERQKSKNLFNAEAIPITSSDVTYDKDTNTFTYTVNSTIESSSTSFTILKYGKLKPGTYTMSFNTTSTIGNTAPVIVAKIDEYDNFSTSIATKNIIDGYVYLTFTLTEETNIGLAWYYKAGWIAGDAPPGVKTLTNLQLEYGSVATDYQPYNGAIIHEKEIADVEHINLLYDALSKPTIGGIAYTSGIGDTTNISNIVISSSAKYIRAYFRANTGNHSVSGVATINLTTMLNENTVYNGNVTLANRYYLYNNGNASFFCGDISISADKTSLSILCKEQQSGEVWVTSSLLKLIRLEEII